MKILIYGSTFITEQVVKNLKHEVVGYIPSENPVFPGVINAPIVSEDTACDIRLSIQYDKKITRLENAYNLHTGLLPAYGGCDILYHTLKNDDKEQGLTLHKMTEKFDEGGIVSKITYPVLEDDTAIDLYKRIVKIAPDFVNASLALLPIKTRPPIKPTLYKRGEVGNPEVYLKDRQEINEYILQSHSNVL